MSKRYSHSPRALRERAALHVSGALDAGERLEFEHHLEEGCEACAAEVARLSEGLPLLAAAVASEPSPSLKNKVMARVSAARILQESPVVDLDGQRFVRSDGLAWADGTSVGVATKTLLVDRPRQRVTRLVRLVPGTAIRPHRHGGVEEVYVVEGELTVEGVLMTAGDYCRAETGSVHRQVRSAGGCVFLVTSSLSDEFLAET